MRTLLIILVIFGVFAYGSSSSHISLTIEHKETGESETREMSGRGGEGDEAYFLVFFDQDPESCDKQAYVNLEPAANDVLKANTKYEYFTGTHEKGQPFFYFYYTEPAGLRYHCSDDLQTGYFQINTFETNRGDRSIKKIEVEFEIHCVVNGEPEKRKASGVVTYEEDSSIEQILKFLE